MSTFGTVKFNPAQMALDASGILRVGQRTTLFDGKILNADDSYIWETAGTGTGTFSGNKFNMNVTSGQWLVRQTKRRFPYFSGKSAQQENTFDNFAPQANLVKRVGYFSSNAVSPYDQDYDGFWIESGGGTISLNTARLGTKTLNNLPITSWSGYADLAEYQDVNNWDYFTVAESKFLWLGGALVSWSIKTSNGFVVAHQFDYAGTAEDVFISSPNQPIRYEIRSTTGTGDLRYVCSQVATEGSINESGEGLSIFGTSAITTNTVGTLYALMGIKKQTTYRDVAVQITDIGVSNAAVTADAGIVFLVINPTLSAALTYGNTSRIQTALATNQTITAGTGRIVAAVPVTSSGIGSTILNNNFLAWLSSTLNNTHDEYVLGYMPTTANQSVFPIMNLKEY